MPDAAVLAALSIDSVRVDKLVREYLTAQSLKILPQVPFGEAVTEFVDKGDKLAMETFVEESLGVQVKELLAIDEGDSEEDLGPFMEKVRAEQEALYEAGVLKRPKKTGKLKPQPPNWDSDEDGPWEEQPGAFEYPDSEDAASAPAPRRGPAGSDDDASVISATTKKNTAKKAPAKRAPAKPRAPAKAKAAPKVPAKSARGRKKVTEPSDDEDDDVIMLDDEPAPAKSQPKRAAAAKVRQTQINFTQSQAKTSAARELSDDEISDDEDAFEVGTRGVIPSFFSLSLFPRHNSRVPKQFLLGHANSSFFYSQCLQRENKGIEISGRFLGCITWYHGVLQRSFSLQENSRAEGDDIMSYAVTTFMLRSFWDTGIGMINIKLMAFT